MNRKERRKRQADVRRDQSRAQTPEQKVHAFAQRFQIELHQAVRRATLPGELADPVATIQSIGYFASVIAYQHKYTAEEFGEAMAHYFRQVSAELEAGQPPAGGEQPGVRIVKPGG